MSEESIKDWTIDNGLKEKFLEACRRAVTDDDFYNFFMCDDSIRCVMTNFSVDNAIEQLKYIKRVNEPLYYQITKPENIRHAYTYQLMKELGMDFSHVVEIGGGYGGLCHVICENENVSSYTIIDLPSVGKLAEKYLGDNLSKMGSLTISITDFLSYSMSEGRKFSLAIAWCSWSELDTGSKNKYYDKIISNADRFFIASNMNPDEDIEILKGNHFENQYYPHIIYK